MFALVKITSYMAKPLTNPPWEADYNTLLGLLGIGQLLGHCYPACLHQGTRALDQQQQQCAYSQVELVLAVNQIPAWVLMGCLPHRDEAQHTHTYTVLISMEMSCISDQANMQSHIACCSRATASCCSKAFISQCRSMQKKQRLFDN